MKTFISIFLVILTASTFAQTRQYFDENGKTLPGPEGARCYRVVERQGDLYLVRDYYASNDQLMMETTATQVSPEIKYEGTYKSYYENGQLEDEGEYKANRSQGLWKSYHENGQQSEEKIHGPKTTTYNQCWDESGNPLLTDGAGTFKRKYVRNGQYHHYEILNSELIASFRIDEVSRDSIYVVVQETAEYKGGMPALYKSVGKTLRYPADARRGGIEGRVFVEFTIDKLGKLQGARCLKGIGGGCDEEAVRTISQLNNWVPGKVKGKPVIQRMVLPVSFKLG
jgi:TonB family protein